MTGSQGQPTDSIQLSSEKRMLLAVKEARAKLEAMQRTKTEPIAIIGMGCRFPGGANSPQAFWGLLANQVDAIAEVPSDRWDINAYYDADPEAPLKMYTRYGGFIEAVDQFDADFFNIAPREVISMDPQQRLLLEVAWEALEHAALVPEQLTGSRTGVFIGATVNDYGSRLARVGKLDAYFSSGNALNAIAGRLAYTLGLQGPCMAVDTACSSSLVAIHLACQSLRNGECHQALAGGINLILAPENTVALSKARMMSPDGRCKTFDASANGFVRGEGCGVLVLKRLSQAEADGDHIEALICGSAVNQDGASSGFTVPNRVAQETLLRDALTIAKVNPTMVDYLEAHGTGTSLGDPIEVKACAAVLGQGRLAANPILLGSVKTNIGHLESAAGVAGLIKVVLSLQQQQIPSQLHFHSPNPYIPWAQLPVKVVAEPVPWLPSEKPRIAGVSSFGATGTNAHVILAEAPTKDWVSAPAEAAERPLHLLTLSAKTPAALTTLTQRYQSYLEAAERDFASICYTANTGRAQFAYRLSVVAPSSEAAAAQLKAFMATGEASGIVQSTVIGTTKLAFLFTGQGSLYMGMGRQLYDSQSVFREALDTCETLLSPYLAKPLRQVMWDDAHLLNQTAYTQLVLFALEYALAQLWQSWGIQPAVLLGEGIGAYAAACVAGVFSLETGLQLVVGQSPLMKDSGSLAKVAQQVSYARPRIPLVSAITGRIATDAVITPEYWCHPMPSPGSQVSFTAGMETLQQLGCEIFLVCGQQCLPQIGEGLWLSSLNPHKSDWQQMFTNLGELSVRGVAIDWGGVEQDYPYRRKVPLPTYPFQRKRYWIEPSETKPDPLEDLLYEIQWVASEHAPIKAALQPGHWLICGDSGTLGKTIAEQLRLLGHTCSLATQWTETPPSSTLGIIWLGRGESPTATTSVASAVNALVEDLLALMQNLIAHPELSQTKLWVLTENAVPLGSEGANPVLGPVWGLSRTFGLEHPQQWGGLIDRGLQSSVVQQAQDLVAEILANQHEEYVAYRARTRYVARLVQNLPQATQPLPISCEGSYLISGGLGGLGLAVAHWLVEHGTRHLILLSRSGMNTPDKQTVVSQWQTQGVQVATPIADVGDREALAQALQGVLEQLPPIRGVIHAAGVEGEIAPIATLDFMTLEHTLEPKVTGSWNLHCLSLAWDLDFFINFSSVAAVWGSAQHAHYGAANAFQDGLAHYRRSQGLPGLTINWSAIAGAGMLEKVSAPLRQHLAQIGVQALDLSQMTAALERLLNSTTIQGVVAAVDWQQFTQIYQVGRSRHLLDLLVTQDPQISAQPTNRLNRLQHLQKMPESEALASLQQMLQQEVRKVLGAGSPLPNPRVGFFDLGMDSLMAVELRTRLNELLGVTLSTTLTFDFPTIEKLTAYIATDLLQLSSQNPKAMDPSLPSLPKDSGALEAIAIIGIGCRFPGGASDPECFWQALQSNFNGRMAIPSDRWDQATYYDPNPDSPGKISTPYGHFLESVDQFDPGFFGISPREATAIDPQHRLLLEVSWEALERAGYGWVHPSNTAVGVFVGSDGHDYEQLLQQHLQQEPESLLAPYMGTGIHISSAAGRLAYTFGFMGPTLTLDTACSSSLVAIHQACNSLRLGECSMALAGGVKLLLTPASYIGASQARMLSVDGQCKTFDASADGYGRGEGCGMVVLKGLAEAERDGDLIWAVIRGSAVNQDGPSSGLTVPNGQAQQHLIRQALAQAHVQPWEISYLEAHGTGTALGDPIEVNAAVGVLGQARSAQHPLWLGSVKTNIGHLEAAAGVSGLIKVVLSLQHQQLPAHLHLQQPNPQIDWQPWLQVPQAATPWQVVGRRFAGVSSFGFTGTNAHVVVEEAPVRPDPLPITWERPVHLLGLSARDPAALGQLAQDYSQHLQTHPHQDLADICFTANTGRMPHTHRLSVVAQTKTELAEALKAYRMGRASRGLVWGNSGPPELPKVALYFGKQSSQYVGMGRRLYETQPTFSKALDQCAAILKDYLDRPLLKILYGADTQESIASQPTYAQPALFAVECALYQLWQAWGVKPRIVIGHGVGEFVAAWATGIFNLQDGLKLVTAYGQLLQHSPNVTTEFEQVAHQIRYSPPQLKLIASLTGQLATTEVTTPEYWCQLCLHPGTFETGLETLHQQGYDIILECGPPSRMSSIAGMEWLPSLIPEADDWWPMLTSLGELYVRGATIDWQGVDRDYPQRRKVTLPTYPFQRQRYWVPGSSTDQKPSPPALLGHKLNGGATGQTVYHQHISLTSHPWIGDHRVYDQPVMPGVSYVAMTFAAIALPGKIEDIRFHEPLFLPDSETTREVELVMAPGSGATNTVDVRSRDLTMSGEWKQHASLIQGEAPPLPAFKVDIDTLLENLQPLNPQILIDIYARGSLVYGPMLQAVQQAWLGDRSALLKLAVPDALVSQVRDEPIHPVLLDACTRLTIDMLDILASDNPESEGVFWAPWRIKGMTLTRPAPSRFYGYVDQPTRHNRKAQTYTYSIHLLDETGDRFGYIENFTLKRAPQQAFLRALQEQTVEENWLYQLQWSPSRIGGRDSVPPAPPAGTWLVFVPDDTWIAPLSKAFAQQGQHCICVSIAAQFQKLQADHYQACPIQRESLQQVLEQVVASGVILQGIVHGWSLRSELQNLPQAQEWVCASTLHLVQALVAVTAELDTQDPSLWLVTQGSQWVTHQTTVQVQQSPLWGLGRVIVREHPELNCRCIDLDPEQAISAEAIGGLLPELLLAPEPEPQIALRQGQRYGARLAPFAPQFAIASETSLNGEASYLISGGLGALGLKVAQRFVERGARTLILLSRGGITQTIQVQAIARLEAAGAKVHLVQVDVGDWLTLEQQWLALQDTIPPLRGVIHAAGVLDDGLLRNQSWEGFARVMAPKVQGGWNLHRLTEALELDFFICFSSAAAVLGSVAQGSYAAANAFLDGLCVYRQELGLPGLSINWGPWAEGGMAMALSPELQSRLGRLGLKFIPPEQGLMILEQQLGIHGQVGVFAFNWDVLRQELDPQQKMLLRNLLPVSRAEPSELQYRLRSATVAERRAIVQETLRKAVVHVLGLAEHKAPEPDQDLFALGLDSLMVVDLRSQLQKTLGIDVPIAQFAEGINLSILGQAIDQHWKQWTQREPYSDDLDASMRPQDYQAIVPETAIIAQWPEYRELRHRIIDELDKRGNIYFRTHEGIARDVTVVQGQTLIHFASYNYLGTSGHPKVSELAQQAINQYGTSVSASRIISGEKPLHRQLEQGLAQFLGVEDCLTFVGGHGTNVTTIGHLLSPGDLIVYDTYSHNSIQVGCQLSGAEAIPFRHNDHTHLQAILQEQRHRYRRTLIAVEGVYSADGDIPPLPEIIALRQQYHCLLMIDEAHSIGVLGKTGRGVGEHFGVNPGDVDIWMGTLSKSFASCGGYIAGSTALVEYLKYTAPGFVFSVGISPANAAAALGALQVLLTEPERVAALRTRAELLRQLLQHEGFNTGASEGTPIIPVIVGESAKAIQLSQLMYEAGVSVSPMVYPAVAPNGARLRFFVTYLHTEAQLRSTVKILVEEWNKLEQLVST